MAWDSAKHPRGPGGKFIKVGAALSGSGKGHEGKSLGRKTPTSPLTNVALKMSGKAPAAPKAPKAGKAAKAGSHADLDAQETRLGLPKSKGSIAQRQQRIADHEHHQRDGGAKLFSGFGGDSGGSLGKVASKMGSKSSSKKAKAPKSAESRDAAIERHVRDVVANNSNPDWTDMADVRDRLDAQGYSRDEQDRVLKDMLRNRHDVRIIPVADTKTLRPRDVQGALRIGVEDNHVIHISPTAKVPVRDYQPRPAQAAEPVRGAKFLASDWTSQPSTGPLKRATGSTPGKAADGATDELHGMSARQLRGIAQREGIAVGPKDTGAQIANHIRNARFRRSSQGAGARHISGR